jgi:hypothetical protein
MRNHPRPTELLQKGFQFEDEETYFGFQGIIDDFVKCSFVLTNS